MYPSSSTPLDISRLTFITQGTDLVIQLPMDINNSEHVVWTAIIRQPQNIILNFEVIQNRDLIVRSRKSIVVEWRIPDWKESKVNFHVQREFTPTNGDLERLLPQLKQLLDHGRKI